MGEQAYDFELLYLFIRALVNMLILTKNQADSVNGLRDLHDEEKQQDHIVMHLIVFLDTVSEEALNDADLSMAFFGLFITYSLRFIILLKVLSSSRDLPNDVVYSLATLVKLVQAKFSTYATTFPENIALFEALSNSELQHEGSCHVRDFYKPANKEEWGKTRPKKTGSLEV